VFVTAALGVSAECIKLQNGAELLRDVFVRYRFLLKGDNLNIKCNHEPWQCGTYFWEKYWVVLPSVYLT